MIADPAASPPPVSSLWLAVLIFAVAAFPLLLTPIIPAVDFNSHLLRYLILADDGATPYLARNYTPDWKLVPNLGLDLMASLLLKFLPPLTAGKVIAASLLLSLYGGTLLLAHAVQGRLRIMTVILAGFLMHNHIYTWGFANFLLGVGIGLAGLAVWLKTSNNPRRQLALAIAIGAILMLVHALAFGIWGIMLAAFELGRAIEARDLGLRSLSLRALRLAAIAVIPVITFLLSATADAPQGVTSSISNILTHAENGDLAQRLLAECVSRLDLLLRITDTRLPWADRMVGLSLWALIIGGMLSCALKLTPQVRVPILVITAMALLIPPNLFGSGYVNDRFPLLLMCLIISSLAAVSPHRLARPALYAASALLAVHLSLVTVQYWRAGRYFDDYIQAVSKVDTGDTTGFIAFSGAGRDELSPLCSPSLILLALVNHSSVQTFVLPTQQPLKLDGKLAAAMQALARQKLKKDSTIGAEAPSTAWRQTRIQQYLTAGFDSVLVCDGAGPPPGTDVVRNIAHGDTWAIYRFTR